MPLLARSVHKIAACETCDSIRTKNCDATRLRPYCRVISNLAKESVGEWGRLLGSTGRSAEGSWEGFLFLLRRIIDLEMFLIQVFF